MLFPSMADLRGKMVPALRVRIPPPKQATAGNGANEAAEPEQTPATPAAKPSVADDFDDEIPF